MSFQLGSRCCIDNLKNDIWRIQGVLKELSSKVDNLEVPSWRFPEKQASCVDVEGVLNTSAFSSSNKEQNASCHVLLLELALDRFKKF